MEAIDPRCPLCSAETVWALQDQLCVGGRVFSERLQSCTSCEWVGVVAFFLCRDANESSASGSD